MRHLKRFAVIMLVVAMILSTAGLAAASTPLIDIAGEPSEEAVEYLFELGVVVGDPGGFFRPARTLNRAEMTKVIVLARLGAQGEQLAGFLFGAPSFPDVAANHWASGYIRLAQNLGIVAGFEDGTFRPGTDVTYAQLITMLVRSAGLAPVGATWPTNYLVPAQAAGITAAIPAGWAAGAPATRGDMAMLTAYTIAEVENPATGKALAQSVFNISAAATITVTGPAAVGLGTSGTFTAVVRDAAGNVIPETVTWTATGGTVVGGIYTPTTAGAQTVTATVGGISRVANVTVFGAASRLALSVSRAIVGNAQSRATLTITAQDAGGNTVSNFSGTASLLSSVPASVALAASSVAVANGVGSVEISSAGLGITTASVISASATGLTGATLVVTPAAQVVTSVALATDPAALAADTVSVAGIRARVLDQEGVEMAAPVDLVVRATLSATDAVDFLGASFLDFDAPGEFNVWRLAQLRAKNIIGTASISGAITAPAAHVGKPVTSTTISTAIIGVPHRLAIDPITSVAAGTAQTIRVRVLDVNGNQITSMATNTATVNLQVGATHVTGSPATIALTASGVAEFTHISTTSATITYTATGTWGTTTLTGATASGTFTVGTATQIALSASPMTINANGVATSTLTAEVRDANNNRVTAGSFPITFTRAAGVPAATGAFPTTVINTVDGRATVVVTATTNIAASDVFTAASTGLASGNVTVTTALMGAANRLQIMPPAAQTVGVARTVNVQVHDGTAGVGVHITSDNGRAVTLTVTDSAGVVVGTFNATTVNGTAAFSVNLTRAGTYTLSAASTGLTLIATGSLTFNVGTLAALSISSDLTTMGNLHQAVLTIGGVDAHGNTVSTWAARDITLTMSPTTLGTPTGPVTHAGTIAPVTTTFTSGTGIGTVSFTAASAGLTSATTNVSIIVVGVPASLRVEPVTSRVVGTAQTVRVTVLDAAGNRVTNATDPITLTASGTTADVDPGLGGIQNTLTVAATKGQASFTVNNTAAQTVTYTATSGTLTSGTGTGVFTVAPINEIRIGTPSPQQILGNGSAISSYTVRVTDINGNTVTTASGTVTFDITVGNDFATVVTPTLTIVNGVGTAMVQSRHTPGVENLITVRARTTDIVKGDGTAIAAVTNNLLLVDGKLPTVTTFLAAQIGAGTSANIVFSEDLSATARTAVQNAILAARTTGTLTFAWAVAPVTGVTTLTVNNTHATAATDFGTAEVTVNITDLAGNTTTGAVIINL